MSTMTRILAVTAILLTACSDGGPNDDRLFVDLIIDPVARSFRINIEITDWNDEYLASEVGLEVDSSIQGGLLPLATPTPRRVGSSSQTFGYCGASRDSTTLTFVGSVAIVWTVFMWPADTVDPDLSNVALSKSGKRTLSCS